MIKTSTNSTHCLPFSLQHDSMRFFSRAAVALLPVRGAQVSPSSSSTSATVSVPPSSPPAQEAPSIPMPPQTIYSFAIDSPLIQLNPSAGPAAQTWNLSYPMISPTSMGAGPATYATTPNGTSVGG